MRLDQVVDALARLLDQRGRAEDAQPEAQRPRDQQPRQRVAGAEDAALERPVRAVLALDVPGDVLGDLDLGDVDLIAELPRDPVRVPARVEVGRALEVVLGLGRVGDLPADPREPEDADVLALVRVADEIELAALEEQVIRIDAPQRGLVALHRVVLELDPLAAVDRGVDLRQPRAHLAAARRRGDAEADRLARIRAQRRRTTPGDLLQREPQRLGIGELAVQQRQRGLQRGALGVGEGDRREVERLGRERVVLLLGEAVRGLVDGQVDAERVELGPVRIKTPRERVLGHVRVALDVAADLRRRHRAALGHEIRDQRQLTDQLFRVFRQTARHLRVPREPYSSAGAEISACSAGHGPPAMTLRLLISAPAGSS